MGACAAFYARSNVKKKYRYVIQILMPLTNHVVSLGLYLEDGLERLINVAFNKLR